MELYHHLAPLLFFAFATAFTPGPNNVLLMASGANFGFRRTVPHLFGTFFGFSLTLVAVALGFGFIFETYPWLKSLLKLAGCAYLFYLAWRIATARRSDGSGGGRPLSVVEAAGFQLLNPKGWMVILSAMTAFTLSGEAYARSALSVVVVFLLVTVGAATTWAGFGTGIARLLKTDRAYRRFNIAMALLTAASVVLILF